MAWRRSTSHKRLKMCSGCTHWSKIVLKLITVECKSLKLIGYTHALLFYIYIQFPEYICTEYRCLLNIFPPFGIISAFLWWIFWSCRTSYPEEDLLVKRSKLLLSNKSPFIIIILFIIINPHIAVQINRIYFDISIHVGILCWLPYLSTLCPPPLSPLHLISSWLLNFHSSRISVKARDTA